MAQGCYSHPMTAWRGCLAADRLPLLSRDAAVWDRFSERKGSLKGQDWPATYIRRNSESFRYLSTRAVGAARVFLFDLHRRPPSLVRPAVTHEVSVILLRRGERPKRLFHLLGHGPDGRPKAVSP